MYLVPKGNTIPEYVASKDFYAALKHANNSLDSIVINGKQYTLSSADTRNYKVWVGSMTQSGTGAPTAVVLENTTGVTPVWGRDSAGNYYAEFTGAIPDTAKVAFFPNNNGVITIGGGGVIRVPQIMWTAFDVDIITVFTAFYNTAAADDLLTGNQVEIRIYP